VIAAITAYYNRPDALRRYLTEITRCEETDVRWYIGTTSDELWTISHIITDYQHLRGLLHIAIAPILSLGAMRNAAVKHAHNHGIQTVVKQDIDCTCENYHEIAAYGAHGFINVGVTDGTGSRPYGNEYSMPTKVWLECGGEPEWSGYGWEDYALIAEMMYLTGQRDHLREVMKGVPLEQCTNVFRDKIARKLNERHTLSMVHHYHERNISGHETNRTLFYNLIQDLIK
jgi:hypothetical protein